MTENNILAEKSISFAIRIVNCYKLLLKERQEYILSKQLLRSGTSIGANVHEAIQAQSRADFISKLNIALKEASESSYWLTILRETEYLSDIEHTQPYAEAHVCNEDERSGSRYESNIRDDGTRRHPDNPENLH